MTFEALLFMFGPCWRETVLGVPLNGVALFAGVFSHIARPIACILAALPLCLPGSLPASFPACLLCRLLFLPCLLPALRPITKEGRKEIARQEERQESKDASDGMSKVGKHISKEVDRGNQTRNNAIKRWHFTRSHRHLQKKIIVKRWQGKKTMTLTYRKASGKGNLARPHIILDPLDRTKLHWHASAPQGFRDPGHSQHLKGWKRPRLLQSGRDSAGGHVHPQTFCVYRVAAHIDLRPVLWHVQYYSSATVCGLSCTSHTGREKNNCEVNKSVIFRKAVLSLKRFEFVHGRRNGFKSVRQFPRARVYN